MGPKPTKRTVKRVKDLRTQSLSARKAKDVRGGCDAGSKDANKIGKITV